MDLKRNEKYLWISGALGVIASLGIISNYRTNENYKASKLEEATKERNNNKKGLEQTLLKNKTPQKKQQSNSSSPNQYPKAQEQIHADLLEHTLKNLIPDLEELSKTRIFNGLEHKLKEETWKYEMSQSIDIAHKHAPIKFVIEAYKNLQEEDKKLLDPEIKKILENPSYASSETIKLSDLLPDYSKAERESYLTNLWNRGDIYSGKNINNLEETLNLASTFSNELLDKAPTSEEWRDEYSRAFSILSKNSFPLIQHNSDGSYGITPIASQLIYNINLAHQSGDFENKRNFEKQFDELTKDYLNASPSTAYLRSALSNPLSKRFASLYVLGSKLPD
jgi:hypothetical protein